MKIGRVRRRKKFVRVQNRKNRLLASLYLWWVFGNSILHHTILPGGIPLPSFNCKFVILVSAGSETDELIYELDRPGKFYICFFNIQEKILCFVVVQFEYILNILKFQRKFIIQKG